MTREKSLGDDTAAAGKIKSNQDFIAWVADFTSSNINGGTEEAKAPGESAEDTTPDTPAAVKETGKVATKAPPKAKATAVVIKPVATAAQDATPESK